MIRKAGLDFIPIGSAEFFEDVQNDPDVWHARRGPMLVMRYVQETLREVYDMVVTEAVPGTTLVGSSLCLGVRSASEKLALPMATIHLVPICIRSSQQMPVLPGGFDANWIPRILAWTFLGRGRPMDHRSDDRPGSQRPTRRHRSAAGGRRPKAVVARPEADDRPVAGVVFSAAERLSGAGPPRRLSTVRRSRPRIARYRSGYAACSR